MPEEKDIGGGVTIKEWSWYGDKTNTAGGLIIDHPNKETGEHCSGTVTFDVPISREKKPAGPFWTVEQKEPLTLSPSILCSCGHHGWIRNGKWVDA